MSFNFFSLDYLYYPVSGIMWVWHKVFGSFMGADNAWAWVLSVVFLVFTLRALLFKPFMKQMDSQVKMQAVQPQMKKLREKYKDDRQRLTEEMMKLNKEAGVNPIGGCLPALIQAPVFIGLFHVLRMFQPVPDGAGGWMFRDSVYFFGSEDVKNFGLAKLFGGAPLGGSMSMDFGQLTYMGGVRDTIIWVGVPLTILAGIATHLTSRRSVMRQRALNPESANSSQSRIMNKLMMWVFPAFVVVGGPFFPLAILFYWLSNNSWTFGQLWVAHRIQDQRRATEAVVVEEDKQARRYSTPRPGARPQVGPKPKPGAKPQRPAAGTKPVGAKPTGAKPTGAKQAGAKPAGARAAGSTSNGGKPTGNSGKRPDLTKKPATTESSASADSAASTGGTGSAGTGSRQNTGGKAGAAAGSSSRPPGSRPNANRNRSSGKKKSKKKR